MIILTLERGVKSLATSMVYSYPKGQLRGLAIVYLFLSPSQEAYLLYIDVEEDCSTSLVTIVLFWGPQTRIYVIIRFKLLLG
jgi:hypothetical protein